MLLRVERGKGQKNRHALLSPLLLGRLRVWWRVARAQGKMAAGGWLFPSCSLIEPVTTGPPNHCGGAVWTGAFALKASKQALIKSRTLASSEGCLKAAPNRLR